MLPNTYQCIRVGYLVVCVCQEEGGGGQRPPSEKEAITTSMRKRGDRQRGVDAEWTELGREERHG